MSPQNALQIGELAAQMRTNPKTIRYYEDIGLLPQPKRSPNGYRLYDDADRDRLSFIQKAKAVGLTLEEIGEILALWHSGIHPCAHLLDLLDAKLRVVEAQLCALAHFRDSLVTLREEARSPRESDACICGIIEQFSSTTKSKESFDRRGNGDSARGTTYETIPGDQFG